MAVSEKSPNQIKLYHAMLNKRAQRKSKTLSELGQNIRRLTCLAYSTVSVERRETPGKDALLMH